MIASAVAVHATAPGGVKSLEPLGAWTAWVI